MIDFVITSYKEPKTIGKAIKSLLNQDIKGKFQIVVTAPDDETLNVAKELSKKDNRIKTFKDPGKGKMEALHLLFQKLKGEILVLTDGDVFVKENTVKYLLEPFKDARVGVTTGRPISIDSKNKMLGYWSHLLCDAGAHMARLKRAKKGELIECSGYLWAFRNNIIKEFPKDVPEDAAIPLLFQEKGYKVAYTPKAIVYVSYPKNFRDFIDQKKRTTKAHVQMSNYFSFKKVKKTKSFKNEFLESRRALLYPETPKEVFWTLSLFPAKLYVWLLVYYHVKIAKKYHKDGWRATVSTKN